VEKGTTERNEVYTSCNDPPAFQAICVRSRHPRHNDPASPRTPLGGTARHMFHDLRMRWLDNVVPVLRRNTCVPPASLEKSHTPALRPVLPFGRGGGRLKDLQDTPKALLADWVRMNRIDQQQARRNNTQPITKERRPVCCSCATISMRETDTFER